LDVIKGETKMKKHLDLAGQEVQRYELSINRITRLVALMLVSLLWTASSFAGILISGPTVTIEPRAPTTEDAVQIKVSGVWSDGCFPRYETHSLEESGRIKLYYSSTRSKGMTCPMAVTPWKFTVDVGRLPSGEYEVHIHINGKDNKTIRFTVGERQCDTHATYSLDKGRLTIPFMALPLLNPETHQPTGEIAVFQAELKLKKGLFVDFTVLPYKLKFVSFTPTPKACHAVYSFQDKTLTIPFVKVDSEVYEATFKHLQEVPVDLGVLRLESYKYLYTATQ
jgi:hypothetical protein